MSINVIWKEWEKGFAAFRWEQVKESCRERDYTVVDKLETCETEAEDPIGN